MREPESLIVGGDSLIGRALAEIHRRRGIRARSTTRRMSRLSNDRVFLDLQELPETLILPDVSCAFICAGITKLADCEKAPQQSWNINIDSVLRVAEQLHRTGSFLVYLSSSQVFDGSRPYCDAKTPPNPAIEYGRQKAAAEAVLLRLGSNVAVVRLTKVLHPGFPLFDNWRGLLEHGEIIHPFHDMPMAPVWIDQAAECLLHIGEQRLEGIHHLSAPHDISYADAARIEARALGLPEELIEPISWRDAELDAVPPANTAMAPSQFQSPGGIKLHSADTVVGKCFEAPSR